MAIAFALHSRGALPVGVGRRAIQFHLLSAAAQPYERTEPAEQESRRAALREGLDGAEVFEIGLRHEKV